MFRRWNFQDIDDGVEFTEQLLVNRGDDGGYFDREIQRVLREARASLSWIRRLYNYVRGWPERRREKLWNAQQKIRGEQIVADKIAKFMGD